MYHDIIEWLLAGVGGSPAEVKEDLGTVVENIGNVGGEPKGARYVIQGGGAGGTYFLVRCVGDDPPNGPDPGGVSTQGIYMDHWEAALEFAGRKLGVPTFGDGDSGGGV